MAKRSTPNASTLLKAAATKREEASSRQGLARLAAAARQVELQRQGRVSGS